MKGVSLQTNSSGSTPRGGFFGHRTARSPTTSPVFTRQSPAPSFPARTTRWRGTRPTAASRVLTRRSRRLAQLREPKLCEKRGPIFGGRLLGRPYRILLRRLHLLRRRIP